MDDMNMEDTNWTAPMHNATPLFQFFDFLTVLIDLGCMARLNMVVPDAIRTMLEADLPLVQGMTKQQLANLIAGRRPVSMKTVMRVIENLTGSDPALHLWSTKAESHGNDGYYSLTKGADLALARSPITA